MDDASKREIDTKLERAKKALETIKYPSEDVSAKELHDYMTGEIFSEDPTTLQDVLGNEYLMVHELSEISELKKMGGTIDRRVIVDSPKILIYKAHLRAMELELDYALLKKDSYWAKFRLRQHKESVLEDDPNLPKSLRPQAEALYKRYASVLKQSPQ